jgi:putative holliday junction resolvase
MKYLGVDLGLKRTGLAISEGQLARPLTVISGNSLDEVVSQVIKIIGKEGIEVVIIGQPESGPVVSAVDKFSKKLASIAGIEIKIVDETLSTQQAQNLMLEMGVSKKSRGQNDAQAAALILQNYLDDTINN